MAVVAVVGFEGQSRFADSTPSGTGGTIITLSGTASYSTSTFRTGAAALRCNPASGASGNAQITTNTFKYCHFAINVATLPSVDRVVAGQITAGQIHAKLTSTGAIAVYLNTTLIGTSTTTLTTGTWYWIGLRYETGTSVVFLQINGTDEVTGTATVTATDGGVGFRGTEASAVDAYFDDISVRLCP